MRKGAWFAIRFPQQLLKTGQGAAGGEQRCSRADRTTSSVKRKMACQRKRKMAQGTQNRHCNAGAQQRQTHGPGRSLLLTDLTTHHERPRRRSKSRKMDKGRLRPVKACWLSGCHAKTERATTQETLALTAMWAILSHAKC